MMFSSSETQLGLGVFPSYQDAEVMLEKLKQSGFPVKQLAFLTKCNDRHDELTMAVSEDRYVGALPSATNPIPQSVSSAPQTSQTDVTAGMLSGLTGLVDQPAELNLLGVGSVIAAGRVKAAIIAANGDNASLDEVYRSLGVSAEAAKVYSDRVYRGDCLVGIEGPERDILPAEKILTHGQINHWQIFSLASSSASEVSEQGHSMPHAPVDRHPDTYLESFDRPVTHLAMAVEPNIERSQLAVGAFRHYPETELALRDLQKSGFDMASVSVITRDSAHAGAPEVGSTDVIEQHRDRPDQITQMDLRDDDHPHVGKGAAAGAITGGSVGGLAGLLVGLGSLAIPGIGPVLLVGSAATAIATTLAGGAIGAAAGSLLGALVGLGIPEDRAKVYRDRLTEGHYLVVVRASSAAVHQAESILNARGIEEWGVYASSEMTTARALEAPYNGTLSNQYPMSMVDYPSERGFF